MSSAFDALLGQPLDPPPQVDREGLRERHGVVLPPDYRRWAEKYPELFINEVLPVPHPGAPLGRDTMSQAEVLLERIRRGGYESPLRLTASVHVVVDGLTGKAAEVEPRAFPPLWPEPRGLLPTITSGGISTARGKPS
ncbi:hypothetical protein GCM10027589_35050 [Actinocorallia lasiicapitis]